MRPPPKLERTRRKGDPISEKNTRASLGVYSFLCKRGQTRACAKRTLRKGGRSSITIPSIEREREAQRSTPTTETTNRSYSQPVVNQPTKNGRGERKKNESIHPSNPPTTTTDNHRKRIHNLPQSSSDRQTNKCYTREQ